ncbi:hypothetical protein M2226_008939 [Bradyrhizobium elkanii]|uniref:hypothetical protein n=1 Tax=Bradyrhizobium elkanii TaxID=29448 RepID=UPI0022266640|nr:hypothetical protein [Bradyrhizobium elkanii]MCW2130195.1 hypothetical protein [Bradyrhizobium elkanii]MCW2167872.1 hypothetical protein [Bradyrhizobium elkanii]
MVELFGLRQQLPFQKAKSMTIEKFRDHLTEMRAIATDSEGREVLVGLTFEETALYFDHLASRTSGARPSAVERGRFRALRDKHELTRLQVVGAEVQKRTDNPTMN